LSDIRIVRISVDGESTSYKYRDVDEEIIRFKYKDEISSLEYKRGKIKLEPISL
jgi:hypothetical protein